MRRAGPARPALRDDTPSKSARAARVYVVYAIELDDPTYPGHAPRVYVGSTAKRPEERFAQHKAGGRLANSMAYRFGTRLRPDLTKRLGPYATRDAAEAAETRLRRRLERRGWVVYGGSGRRLFEDWPR
jgi:hypothetical protein